MSHNVNLDYTKSRFKTPFAFDKQDKLIDRLTAVKGEIYYCSCGGAVKIKAGEVRERHFFHLKTKDITERKCSLESNIHKAYKQRFYELKKLLIPGVGLVNFNTVELEKEFANKKRRADAIGIRNEQQWIVEFKVTHPIEDDKLKDIIDVGTYNCIEISSIFPKDKDGKAVYKGSEHLISVIDDHLLNLTEYKQIIFKNIWMEKLLKYGEKKYNEGMLYEQKRNIERLTNEQVEKTLLQSIDYNKGYYDGYTVGKQEAKEAKEKTFFDVKKTKYGYSATNRDLRETCFLKESKDKSMWYIELRNWNFKK